MTWMMMTDAKEEFERPQVGLGSWLLGAVALGLLAGYRRSGRLLVLGTGLCAVVGRRVKGELTLSGMSASPTVLWIN